MWRLRHLANTSFFHTCSGIPAYAKAKYKHALGLYSVMRQKQSEPCFCNCKGISMYPLTFLLVSLWGFDKKKKQEKAVEEHNMSLGVNWLQESPLGARRWRQILYNQSRCPPQVLERVSANPWKKSSQPHKTSYWHIGQLLIKNTWYATR